MGKRMRLGIAVGIAAALVACTSVLGGIARSAGSGGAAGNDVLETSTGGDGGIYENDCMLVSFDGSIGDAALRELLRKQGIETESIETVSTAAGDGSVLAQVRYTHGPDPIAASKRLDGCEFIRSAEPNYVYELGDGAAELATTGVDDEYVYWGEQWGLDAIGAPSAWDLLQADGKVTVAVLDSGADYTHPDLSANLVDARYACDSTGSTLERGADAVADSNGHGTHVAGIIAACANNKIGVAGVSYNARVLPVKVTVGSSGSVPAAGTIAALDYVTQLKTDPGSPEELKNLRVVNLSLGGFGLNKNIDAAIQRARKAGLVVVAAAGNNGAEKSAYYPASFDNVIAVSNLEKKSDGSYEKYSGSNWGSYVDLAAPGTRILSTYPGSIAGYEYAYYTGTSQATPMVAGVAALAWSRDMDAAPADIEQALIGNAQDLGDAGRDSLYGHGLVRADSLAENWDSLANAAIAPIGDQIYTGTALKPALQVSCNNKTLVAGVDYTARYSNNTDIGEASVELEGAGSYTGSASATFKVVRVPAQSVQAAAIANVEYSGSALKPAPILRYRTPAATFDLAEGSDYELAWRDNVDAGEASIDVAFKGRYTGSMTLHFTIEPKRIDAPQAKSGLASGGGRVLVGVEGGEGYRLSGTYAASAAGEYEAHADLVSENYLWSDGSRDTVHIPWSVDEVRDIPYPTGIEGLVYNGQAQLGVPEGEGYTLGTGSRATDAGSHVATIALQEGYRWDVEDETAATADAHIAWSIARKPVAEPDAFELPYSPNIQRPFGEITTTNTALAALNLAGSGTAADPLEQVRDGSVVQVAAGTRHYAALRADGSLWMWGSNTYGQLGCGDNADRSAPVQVLDGVAGMALGANSSAAVMRDGSVWTWGRNANGQLGDGTTADRNAPVQVAGMSGAVQVALGSAHALALCSDGSVYAWGRNANGQLGCGTTAANLVPVRVSGLAGAVQVAAGSSFSAAVKADGSVWTWGANAYGQLGCGEDEGDKYTPVQVQQIQFTENDYSYAPLQNAASVALGSNHAAALASDGSVYTWGLGTEGQLGFEADEEGEHYDLSAALEIPSLHGIAQLSLRGDASAAVGSDGALWAWGAGDAGALDNGSGTPTRVEGLAGVTSAALAGGRLLACGTDGSLQIWEPGSVRELRSGARDAAAAATAPDASTLSAMGLEADSVRQIAAGFGHYAVLGNDGSLWMWGNNSYGQLGDGTTADRTTPAKVDLENVTQVALGYFHSAAVTSDGSLYTWGYNGFGQLGHGTQASASSPQKVATVSNVKQVAAGAFHSAALAADGSLWSFGDNRYGQLGCGGYREQDSPVQAIEADVRSVELGAFHSAALKTDDSLWLWGRNDSGQLGGEFENTAVPNRLLGAIAQVSLGYDASAVVKEDATLWAWGANEHGQLGIGSHAKYSAPRRVDDDIECVSLSKSAPCAYAISTYYGLLAWGAVNAGANGAASPAPQVMGHTARTVCATGFGCMTARDSVSASQSEPYALVGATAGQALGEYRTALVPDANHCWEDGSTAGRKVSWNIVPLVVEPQLAHDLVYDGSEQVGLAGGEHYRILDGSTTAATDAGTYEAAVALDGAGEYTWADGGTDKHTLSWTIAAKRVAPDVAGDAVYDGNEHSGVRAGEGYTLDGTASAKGAGEYEAQATLANSNYAWADGDENATKTISWSIAKQQVDAPCAPAAALPYTGSKQTVAESSAGLYTVEGGSATERGTYTCTAALADTGNYEWSSGEADPVQFTWTITYGVYDMSGASVEDKAFSYDGREHELAAPAESSLPTGVSIASTSYSVRDAQTGQLRAPTDEEAPGGMPTYSGTYVFTVAFASSDDNYPAPKSLTATLTIDPVKVEVPRVLSGYAYDGQMHRGINYENDLAREALPYKFSDEDNEHRDVGLYETKVQLKDTRNYVWDDETGGSGERAVHWYISAYAIEAAGIDDIPAQYYSGSAVEPNVTVRYGAASEGDPDSNKLTRAASDGDAGDYTLEYLHNDAPGTGSVVVTGTNNFMGSKRAAFSVLSSNLEDGDVTVELDQDEFVYSGSHCRPKVTVAGSGGIYTEGVDYDVSYENNTGVGEARAIVRGRGQCTGERSAAFSIRKREAVLDAADSISLAGGSSTHVLVTYDGDGELNFSCSNLRVCSVAYSAKTLTITGLKAGEATITLDAAATDTCTAAGPVEVRVTVTSDAPEARGDGNAAAVQAPSAYAADGAVYSIDARTKSARLMGVLHGTVRCTVPAALPVAGANYRVGDIPADAFKGSATLKEVAIEAGSAIPAGAFSKCKKLKAVTIGTQISQIGAKAFFKCGKLKTVKIMTDKLSAKTVGAKAFKGIAKKAKLSVPKAKLSLYKKFLKKKGLSKKAKIKKL